MPYRTTEFARGQYYHIYNRGAGKSKIFFIEDNYRYLLKLMQRYMGKYSVSVIAYCLMPNHYHFLLMQLTGEPLSKFINVLFNAYVQALNDNKAVQEHYLKVASNISVLTIGIISAIFADIFIETL